MHLHKRELYEMELNLIDIWLEKHPTDTSGWSYLERRLIILWLQLNQHRLPCSYIDESIIESLNPVEPLLYQALDIITKLKSSDNMYRINFSFNEFLNWAYKNKICHEPSTLKWIDLLSLRYLFWLSEYLTGSSKIE
ncbi:prenyltransferase alpha subunit repeat-containing 1 [Schistosoma japonicum]|nr:prenyltransferase alpha subunit repeat-containing 1 [Schistosoma japonicum]KAH8856846.1 prenyltransferase alpha subunit repeat-containing 1 [Schistosoma japonicum]